MPNAPGGADRFHVETHIAERRDVFITDDKALLRMCRRLSEEHGLTIVAMGLADYLGKRQGQDLLASRARVDMQLTRERLTIPEADTPRCRGEIQRRGEALKLM